MDTCDRFERRYYRHAILADFSTALVTFGWIYWLCEWRRFRRMLGGRWYRIEWHAGAPHSFWTQKPALYDDPENILEEAYYGRGSLRTANTRVLNSLFFWALGPLITIGMPGWHLGLGVLASLLLMYWLLWIFWLGQ